LPDSLLVAFFFIWSDLKSLGYFDSAMCSRNDRNVYLIAISFEKQGVEQLVIIDDNKDTCLIFYRWMLKRRLTLKRIKFVTAPLLPNINPREWLSNSVYKLNTTQTISDLKFEERHIFGLPIWITASDLPPLAIGVSRLINRCKTSLKVLHFVNFGVYTKGLMNLIEWSDLAVNELVIIEEKLYEVKDTISIDNLMQFDSLTTLKLKFIGSYGMLRISQQSIVSLLEMNRNLTHLDLDKVMVEDSFLSSVSTHCKALKQFLCISLSEPSGEFPSASAIVDYLRAPHESLELMRLESLSRYYDTINGISVCIKNSSGGKFSFEFNKRGTITASVVCSKQTVKSIFVALLAERKSVLLLHVNNVKLSYCGDELTRYLKNL
jgi:hypothetical protein